MAHSPAEPTPTVSKPPLLAADLGATHTRLGIFSSDAGPTDPLVVTTLATADLDDAGVAAKAFVESAGVTVDRAVFAAAGPVLEDRITAGISHLPWDVDQQALKQALDLENVVLINDVAAMAMALPILSSADLHTLAAGRPAPGGTTVVIAPGTGLGEAFNIPAGVGVRTCVSEGGQSSFAPTNDFEIQLLEHVRKTGGHVSWEMVCSGMGIPKITDCLEKRYRMEPPAWFADQLARAADPTVAIIAAAVSAERNCDLAIATLDRFTSILGARAATMALQVVATGGVYLGGGIPQRILPYLEQKQFLKAFRNKGIMTEMLENIPIHVITNPDTALIGAATILLPTG